MTTTDSTDITIYVGIGNSDNKLTQRQWSDFCANIHTYLRTVALDFLGEWHSLPTAPWQNAEYAATIRADRLDDVRGRLAIYRKDYIQDSIALAIVDRTEFIR